MHAIWKYTKVALLTFIACVFVYGVGALTYDRVFPPDGISTQVTEQADGSYRTLPSVGASLDYGKDFKTYTSRSGFSFNYPPYLEVMDLLSHVVLRPVDEESDSGSVVISVGINDENMTAEEWLLSPDSGYLQSKDLYGNYYKTTIDGQDAVYTDGGMWTVVDTPDDKYRLSIADLPSKSNNRLFTEMGIVIDSLVFNP
jgi:hypothetical protein